MSIRRTTGNRRRTVRGPGRHHLLEVNVRTASIKRQRRTKAGSLLWKISGLVIFLSLAAVGLRVGADKFFFQNPEYSLRHLESKLEGIMTREELEGMTGFREGKNVFLLDLDRANRTLSAIPEVRSAAIERILPDTVKVSLEQRVPIFLIASSEEGDAFVPGKSYLCDRDSIMIRPARLDAEFLNLPVVRGIDLAEAVPGKPLRNEHLARAIRLQQALGEIPEESFTIRSVDVSKSYAAVVTDSSGARFTFGGNDLPSQLERLRKLLSHCQESGRRIESANLMVSRNTPVTFVLSSPGAAPKITPVSPSAPSPKKEKSAAH